MQTIWTSLQTDNNTNTPPLNFLQAGCSSWCPTNSVKALNALKAHWIAITIIIATHDEDGDNGKFEANLTIKSNHFNSNDKFSAKTYDPRSFHLVVLKVGNVFLAHPVVLHFLLQLWVACPLRAQLVRRLRQILLNAALRLTGRLQMLVITMQLRVNL